MNWQELYRRARGVARDLTTKIYFPDFLKPGSTICHYCALHCHSEFRIRYGVNSVKDPLPFALVILNAVKKPLPFAPSF